MTSRRVVSCSAIRLPPTAYLSLSAAPPREAADRKRPKMVDAYVGVPYDINRQYDILVNKNSQGKLISGGFLLQILNGHERFCPHALGLGLASHTNETDRAEQFHQGPGLSRHRPHGRGLLVESRQGSNPDVERRPHVADFLHSRIDIDERDATPGDAKMLADILVGIGVSEGSGLAGGGIQHMLQQADIRPQNELLAADHVARIGKEHGVTQVIDGLAVVEPALQ